MRKRARSMLIGLVWIGIASATALQGPTTTPEGDCPRISVSCGDAHSGESTPITFRASVTGGKPTRQISYCWTVSAGTIKSGQGTPVIEVEASGRDRQGLNAVINIGGFDSKCASNASCATPLP